MGKIGYWTAELLNQLIAEINGFEIAAFEGRHVALLERKRCMKFASNNCSDENIRFILGRAVDDIGRNPGSVRRAIHLARSHVEVLRETHGASSI